MSTGHTEIDWQRVINVIGNELERADEREAARLRHRLGYIAMLLGDVRTKAVEAFTMMHDSATNLQDRALLAMAETGLSHVYDTLGERYKSLEYAERAVRLAEESGDQRLLGLALNAQAQFYKENGQNRRAAEIYNRIQAIGQTLDDPDLIMAAAIGKGRTSAMADVATGVAEYEKAIAMAKAKGDEQSLIVGYNNLADWKIYQGKYEEAIALRTECLRLGRKWQSKIDVGRALIGMAKAYTLLGDLEKARELLYRGMPAVISAGDIEGDLHAGLNLAYLYVQSGDIPRACELYRQVLERSLAAPDHACAIFAQKALDLLAEGQIPAPGILPERPLTEEVQDELSEDELDGVVGGVDVLRMTYPTGDLKWKPSVYP
jgi:tetratricopeptide (TPR) repeat protein